MQPSTHVEHADLCALVVADLDLILELDLEGDRLKDHLAHAQHHLCVRRLPERILRLGGEGRGVVSIASVSGGSRNGSCDWGERTGGGGEG